jgi:hypothetical protein
MSEIAIVGSERARRPQVAEAGSAGDRRGVNREPPPHVDRDTAQA